MALPADNVTPRPSSAAPRPGRAGAGPRRKSASRDYAEAILIAVAVAFVLRAFVVQAFKIPSGSMKPTLLVGDFILVEKVSYWFRAPARGDVVVFKYPHQDNELTPGKQARELFELVVRRRRVPRRDYVKRIVGLPGDVIQGKGGAVVVNGRPYLEPYAGGIGSGDFGPFKVPPAAYFVLGDHRADSRDSRHWGFVPAGLVRGRACIIYWSWIPGYCMKHRSAVSRLYHVRLTGSGGFGSSRGEGAPPGDYICDAGGETLRDGDDVRVTPWYNFWEHIRWPRLFLLVE
jgi:signal peptidase I